VGRKPQKCHKTSAPKQKLDLAINRSQTGMMPLYPTINRSQTGTKKTRSSYSMV